MSDKVSKSKTGQNEPVPSREERDASFSSTGGRKAVEVDKAPRAGNEIEPPVGLDMETRGDENWTAGTSADSTGDQPKGRAEQKVSDDEDVPVDDGRDIEG